MLASDMASWREGGKPSAAMSEEMSDDRLQLANSAQPISTKKSSASVSTNELQKQQAYIMANSQQHYHPAFHGPMPPAYMAMRPGIKPPPSAAVGPMPFHMGPAHMPMMPPNYSAMMMPPFVCSFRLLISYSHARFFF